VDAEPTLDSIAFLEFKESSGNRRHKTRHGIGSEDLRKLLRPQTEMDADEAHSLKSKQPLYALARGIRSGEFIPVFSTWYRRMSLSCAAVRLTIDENVTFCRPLGIGVAGNAARPGTAIDMMEGRIIEIKTMGAIPQWLSGEMHYLSDCDTPSKFVRGLAATRRPKHNDFASTKPLAILAPMRTKANV